MITHSPRQLESPNLITSSLVAVVVVLQVVEVPVDSSLQTTTRLPQLHQLQSQLVLAVAAEPVETSVVPLEVPTEKIQALVRSQLPAAEAAERRVL